MASPKISHLILNTANYEPMKQWYLDVFEAKIGVETSDHSACFLQMDESHHRIGMFNVAKTDESVAMTYPGAQNPGALSRLNHFAFEYPTLAELLDAYRRLAASSVLPAASLNHGPTMSIYYQDPDRNIVELFYDNQYTDEQIAEFYAGGDGTSSVHPLRPGRAGRRTQRREDGCGTHRLVPSGPAEQPRAIAAERKGNHAPRQLRFSRE